MIKCKHTVWSIISNIMSSKRNLYVFSTSEKISDTTDEQLAIIKKTTLYTRCRFDKEIYIILRH